MLEHDPVALPHAATTHLRARADNCPECLKPGTLLRSRPDGTTYGVCGDYHCSACGYRWTTGWYLSPTVVDLLGCMS